MSKERVSALAKQVGIPSAQLIEWLNANGTYVRTPSSTIESAVVAKVFAHFAGAGSTAPSFVLPPPGPDPGVLRLGPSDWTVAVRFEGESEWFYLSGQANRTYTRSLGSSRRFASNVLAQSTADAVETSHRIREAMVVEVTNPRRKVA